MSDVDYEAVMRRSKRDRLTVIVGRPFEDDEIDQWELSDDWKQAWHKTPRPVVNAYCLDRRMARRWRESKLKPLTSAFAGTAPPALRLVVGGGREHRPRSRARRTPAAARAGPSSDDGPPPPGEPDLEPPARTRAGTAWTYGCLGRQARGEDA